MNILKQMPANVSGVDDATNDTVDTKDEQRFHDGMAQPVTPAVTPVENTDHEKLVDMIGKKVGYKQNEETRSKVMQEEAATHGIQIGANIYENADIRDGWQVVDRRLFGERDIYYPADWEFRIRPATVEAIRNWSTIDDEQPNTVDDVFNEIVKSCFSIKTPQGLIPWGNLRSWDRFFVLLLIRQYTFAMGES